MVLALAEQWSNNNKNEEPKQEKLNQGLSEAMVGSNGVNNFGAEGAGGTAGCTNMGNTGGDESAGSGEKKHIIDVAIGAVTHNASVSGDGTTFRRQRRWWWNREQHTRPLGWEWAWADNQEPLKKQPGPIDDVQRCFLPCPSVILFNYLFLFSNKFS
jgi:hypothetical protein